MMASRQERYSCGRIGTGKASDHCGCAPSRTSLLRWPLRALLACVGNGARLLCTPGLRVGARLLQGEERTILMRKPLVLTGAISPPTRDDLAVFAMCGIAFAGKSTAARRVASALELNLISLDAINAERGLSGGEGIPDARWEETSFVARGYDRLSRVPGFPFVRARKLPAGVFQVIGRRVRWKHRAKKWAPHK